MSTIVTDKVEVRANQASIIGTVLQQFVPEWTPSGAAKFTPLVIRNFKCKMNVRIKPSDIMEDILGYMYDEQASTLQSMPIVRYILWQLVFPKLDEERENALALGRFKENIHFQKRASAFRAMVVSCVPMVGSPPPIMYRSPSSVPSSRMAPV